MKKNSNLVGNKKKSIGCNGSGGIDSAATYFTCL